MWGNWYPFWKWVLAGCPPQAKKMRKKNVTFLDLKSENAQSNLYLNKWYPRKQVKLNQFCKNNDLDTWKMDPNKWGTLSCPWNHNLLTGKNGNFACFSRFSWNACCRAEEIGILWALDLMLQRCFACCEASHLVYVHVECHTSQL